MRRLVLLILLRVLIELGRLLLFRRQRAIEGIVQAREVGRLVDLQVHVQLQRTLVMGLRVDQQLVMGKVPTDCKASYPFLKYSIIGWI